MSDAALKVRRVAAFARTRELGGILLGSPPAFTWVTDGGSNRIDLTRDPGAGALFVTADERVYLCANEIEQPRLMAEAVASLAPEPVSCPWIEERANPAWMVARVRALAGDAAIGADWTLAGAAFVDVAPLRVPLTPRECALYRTLGADAGRVIGDLCAALTPGITEQQIANRVVAAAASIGARALVTLVGADARLLTYRHPIPTDRVWEQLVMVATCVERGGLVVALSRFVAAAAPSLEFRERLARTAAVFGALLRATTPGATGADLYAAAVDAYAREGVPGEERRHHQGGAIGYRGRDWVAHPASRDIVHAAQAFAWNPSITGTKVEDTALLTASGLELVTSSPGWPTIALNVAGADSQPLAAADVLVL